jgi:acyl dehydratase
MTLYFEDLVPGTVYELGEKEVTEEEMLRFAREFDPQDFHVDPGAARGSEFGGVVASGLHVFGMFWRLTSDGLMAATANLGGSGVDGMRWRIPVRAGDVLHARVRIMPDSRVSASKPDRGVLVCRGELENQHGELVWEATFTCLVRRRSR